MLNVANPTQKRKAGTRKLRFVPVSRNLLEWPLARHGHAKLEWYELPRLGVAQCVVNAHTVIQLPIERKLRRHLSGFDVVTLLTLTGIARRKGYTLEITNKEILENMGVGGYRANRQRLADALELLDGMTIVHLNWYWPERKQRAGKNVSEVFSPVKISGVGGRRKILMDPNWVRATSRYFQAMPTPLPVGASTLNLLMLILGAPDKGRDEQNRKVKRFRSKRWITRRLGLNSTSKNTELDDHLEELDAWFRSLTGHSGRKGELVCEPWESGLEIRYRLPRTARVRLRQAVEQAA